MDLGREHIVDSVEKILQRLSTDHLDILLLHAFSTLARPEDIAAAFDQLHHSGKVRYFGVSNYNAVQIQLLQKFLGQPLVVNQIHLGLAHAHALAEGSEFALEIAQGVTKNQGYAGVSGGGTFDFCRLHDIQIQAWSPLRGDLVKPPVDADVSLNAIREKLLELAQRKNSTPSALALSWLLHHPAGILPVIGASRPEHIVENCAADRVELSAEEWYALFVAGTDLQSRALRF